MAGSSNIEWTDASWNPIVGCSIVSPGCINCYAMKMAARIEAMTEANYDRGAGPMPSHYDGTTKKVNGNAVWTGKVAMAPERVLLQPLHWKKPRRIFVNSMGDLFHESIPDEWIDKVFAVMALAKQHTFQVLTKRAERMRRYIEAKRRQAPEWVHLEHEGKKVLMPYEGGWPNYIWLGISAERQEEWDERVPHLLATPAAIRFVSAEPLLDGIDLGVWGGTIPSLDWVVIGGESGPNARGCWVPSVRKMVRQFRKAGVKVFVKQLGSYVTDRNDAGFEGCDDTEWPMIDDDRIEEDLDGFVDNYQGAPVRIRLKDRKGGDMAEWPPDLRIREFPEARR